MCAVIERGRQEKFHRIVDWLYCYDSRVHIIIKKKRSIHAIVHTYSDSPTRAVLACFSALYYAPKCWAQPAGIASEIGKSNTKVDKYGYYIASVAYRGTCIIRVLETDSVEWLRVRFPCRSWLTRYRGWGRGGVETSKRIHYTPRHDFIRIHYNIVKIMYSWAQHVFEHSMKHGRVIGCNYYYY